jgi:hypothetical protein
MPRVRARLFTLRACDFFHFSQILGVEFAVVFVAAASPFRRACLAEADSSRRGAALPLLCLPIICTHTGNILFLANRAAAFSGRHEESATLFQKTSYEEPEKQKPRSSLPAPRMDLRGPKERPDILPLLAAPKQIRRIGGPLPLWRTAPLPHLHSQRKYSPSPKSSDCFFGSSQGVFDAIPEDSL